MLIMQALKWPYLHYKHCFVDAWTAKCVPKEIAIKPHSSGSGPCLISHHSEVSQWRKSAEFFCFFGKKKVALVSQNRELFYPSSEPSIFNRCSSVFWPQTCHRLENPLIFSCRLRWRDAGRKKKHGVNKSVTNIAPQSHSSPSICSLAHSFP